MIEVWVNIRCNFAAFHCNVRTYEISLADAHQSAFTSLEPEGLQLELKLVLCSAIHELGARACEPSINQTSAHRKTYIRHGQNCVCDILTEQNNFS